VNVLSLKAVEKGLTLEQQIDKNVPLCLVGDSVRIRQIITNLVGNAIKFTSRGSVSLQISVESKTAETVTLRFSIRDTGIGIPAEKLQGIFEPFTQADSSTTRKYGGTGLGLAISKQLAEMMGGRICIESIEGEGSTFWFTAVLGIQKDAVPLTAQPVSTEKPADPVERDLSGIRILIAEDEPINQIVTMSIIRKSGYQADLARNGSEALKMLEENDYTLVLMDCMMPEMNGYEATAAIRDPASKARNHNIPVIALTARAMREDQEQCLAAGMDDFLSKPLEVAELVAMIEKWSDRERL